MNSHREAIRNGQGLQEAPLSRILQHGTSGAGFLIASAYKLPPPPGVSDADQARKNLDNTRRLADMARSDGYGFFYVDGVWEDQATGVRYEEVPLFIVGGMDDEKLKRDGMKYAQAFNQDAVLYCPGGENKGRSAPKAYGLSQGGELYSYGEFHPNVAGNLYTRLHGRPGTFVFHESLLFGRDYIAEPVDHFMAEMQRRAFLRQL